MKRSQLLIAGALALAILCGFSAHAAETATAQFSFKKSKFGIPGGGTGTITFRVDPAKKTFSCDLTGSGKLSGSATIYNIPQQINATISLADVSCSGRYYPDEGNIDGTISIKGTYNSTATYRGSSGETQSESDSGSETESGSIYGSLGPGGSGSIDLGQGSMRWKVTRAIQPATQAPPAREPEPAPPPANPATRQPPARPAPAATTPGARPTPASRPEPVQPEPTADEPEPDVAPVEDDGPPAETPTDESAANDDGDVVSEYVRDSMELTNTVMDEYQQYQAGGGGMNLTSFLLREYPSPAEREKVETAIRVAAEEKEQRQKEVAYLLQNVDQTAGEIIGRYNAESVAPAAAGQAKAESFTEYLSRVVTEPEERERLRQSVILSTVNSYETAREGYQTMVGNLSRATEKVEQIWNSVTSGPADTRENWLRQQAAEAAQGKAFQRTREMMPESVNSVYESCSGWKEKYDAAAEMKAAAESLHAKNAEVMALYREGKLDAAGVAALRGLNVLEAGLNAIPVPKGLDTYKEVMVGKDGMGRAVKFTGDFVVYKSSVRNLSDDPTNDQIGKFEQSRKALAAYGEGRTHRPYNNENSFVTAFKSVKTYFRPETRPEHKKYH